MTTHESTPSEASASFVFTTAEGERAGMSVGALRAAHLSAPTRGVRHVGPMPHDAQERRRLQIAALRAVSRQDQFFSHATAALIHGMPLPSRLQRGPIHVASPSFTNRMRRNGVVGHRIKARVVDVDGLRVESPEDAFVHLATLLSVDELVAVGDWIVFSGHPCSIGIDELVAATRKFKGARGMAKVDRALALVRTGAQSPRETSTRLLIVRSGLPEPELQVEVRDAHGARIGFVDLAYPDLRIAIEYEGEQHLTDPAQWAKDIRRYRRLHEAGWLVLRVTKADLAGDGRELIAEIRRARAARRASIGQ